MIQRILLSFTAALALAVLFQPQSHAQNSPQSSLLDAATNSLGSTTKFNSTSFNLSLDVPTNWKVLETQLPYIFKGEVLGGTVNVNIVAEGVDSTVTRSSYGQAILAGMQSNGKVKVVNYTDDDIQVNGVTALRRIQTVRVGEIEVSQITLVIIEQSKAYTYTASVATGAMRLFKPVFERMYNSIWIEGISSRPAESLGNSGARRPAR